MKRVAATLLTAGHAQGELLVLSQPLSLWGGIDLETGEINDPSHPQVGQNVAGKVLAMRTARGSSSSASALVESLRRGCNPAAIVMVATDAILVMGGLVGETLYGQALPIVRIEDSDWPYLEHHERAEVGLHAGTASLTLLP